MSASSEVGSSSTRSSDSCAWRCSSGASTPSPVDSPAELLHVDGIHPSEPVEVFGVVGRTSDHARHPRYALGQTSGYRQGMRTAARPAADREALDVELVGDRGDVADTVDHAAARLASRAPVAWPVVGDQTQPRGAYARQVRVAAAQPTTGGAVDHKHRRARRITDLLKGQRASVARLNSSRAHAAHSPQFSLVQTTRASRTAQEVTTLCLVAPAVRDHSEEIKHLRTRGVTIGLRYCGSMLTLIFVHGACVRDAAWWWNSMTKPLEWYRQRGCRCRAAGRQATNRGPLRRRRRSPAGDADVEGAAVLVRPLLGGVG